MDSIIVEARSLTKHYGDVTAVDDLSLKILKGEIYGFLGLNGAGKTTTLRMLLGMIRPNRGTASLFGTDIRTGKTQWQKVGYMVESAHAYPDLSVIENLGLFCRYYGMTDGAAISRIISLLHLERFKNRKAKHLSLGNRQRLGLAKALIHEPELLILDEPANGLDPAGIVEIRKLLKTLSIKGTSILISSHILSEISKIADKIGIIHEGHLIREFRSDELQKDLKQKLIVDTRDNEKAISLLEKDGYRPVVNQQNEFELTGDSAISDPEKISELLVNEQLPPRKIFLFEEDLESYFLRMISPNHEE